MRYWKLYNTNCENAGLTGWRFASAFIFCSVIFTTIITYAPDKLIHAATELTIVITIYLANLFGVVSSSNGDLLTINGFAMRIITQCTGLHYMIIMASAILLYTGHSLKYRLQGIIVLVPAILLTNSLRLIITGIVGGYSLTLFYFVHDYLWVAAFSIQVLLLWTIWVSKTFTLTRMRWVLFSQVFLISTALFAIFYQFQQLYGNVISLISLKLFSLFPGISNGQIFWDSGKIVFIHANMSFKGDFTTDLMIVSLYLGLVIPDMFCNRYSSYLVIAGFILFVLFDAFCVAFSGYVAVRFGYETAVMVLWSGHGLLLALPIALRLGLYKNTAL